MTPYTVNGHFLCRNLTGIERFSIEILYQLDKIIPEDFLSILIPNNTPYIPDFKKIKIIKSDISLSSFWKWTQFTFGKFVKKNKTIGINFSNECSFLSPGFVFLHDIYCKLYPEDFKSTRDKLVRIYSCMMYRLSAKHSKMLFTVSEFSKNQIAKTYHLNSDKIHVIPNGWEHFQKVTADNLIFEKYNQLNNGFYFTLGSLSKRKNLKWIADYAEKNPQEIFAISGKSISGLVPEELKKLQTLKNVILLGYVSDGEVKALMQKCKAFILPSYYEGFGIPPLEALSTGTKVIVSNASCLPEIYEDCAYYIDPNNTNCNLNDLLNKPVADCSKLLSKYTYQNAAKIFYNILQSYIER